MMRAPTVGAGKTESGRPSSPSQTREMNRPGVPGGKACPQPDAGRYAWAIASRTAVKAPWLSKSAGKAVENGLASPATDLAHSASCRPQVAAHVLIYALGRRCGARSISLS